jgi:alcohol-forming fatty acyl-CoA reductase
LKEQNPDAFEKLHVIEGDVIELNLGIRESDLDKLKTCTVIFHAAASVRFDDPLKSAILLNTRGTREMCKLAQTMPHLKALVHVSTAYIQPKNLYVQERIYPTNAHWETYIDFAEKFDEDVLNILTHK